MKVKYFNRFSSKKEFFNTNLRESTIRKFHNQVKARGHREMQWDRVKLILLHKNCPEDITRRYSIHPLWYVRLVAMLNKNTWREYADYAARLDFKSTVRAAAIRRLWYEGVWSEEKVKEQVKKDIRVQRYFRSLLKGPESVQAEVV